MTTRVLSQASIPESLERTNQTEMAGQYSLGQILGIWALVALPMGLLAWVVAPAIIPYIPLPAGLTFWLLMIAGMVWEFVVSLVIVYRELGTLRWSAIRQRLWLQTPRDPATDRPNSKLFWWLVPAVLFSALATLGLAGFLNAPMAWLFPALQAPGMIHGLPCHAPRDGAVADDRDHPVVIAGEIPGQRHAQAGGNRGGTVGGAERG